MLYFHMIVLHMKTFQLGNSYNRSGYQSEPYHRHNSRTKLPLHRPAAFLTDSLCIVYRKWNLNTSQQSNPHKHIEGQRDFDGNERSIGALWQSCP